MALRTPSLQNDSLVGINREIGSQYDNVKTVAEHIDSVVSVAEDKTNVDIVAANVGNVAATGSNIAQVVTTAAHIDEVVTVAANMADVMQVADALDDIGAVLEQVVPHLDEILLADDNAAIATAKAAEATSQATAATAARVEAETARTTATTKAAEAVVSANSASASATTAMTKASEASASATAAHDSEVAAAAMLDAFNDRYLGSFTVDPTTDNDGQPILDGALYFNTSSNVLKVYDQGTSAWLIIPQTRLSELLDVQLTSIATGDVLKWDGTKWINTNEFSNHVINTNNPHYVTKSQVGLANVDNTADSAKSVLSATKLTTSRTVNLTGDITGTGNFDGSADLSIATTIAANSVALGTNTTGNYVAKLTAGTGIAVTGTAGEGWSPTISLGTAGTAGTYTKVVTDSYGRVISGTTLLDTDIPSLDASKITSGIIDAARLPAYVDDVLEFTNLASFPATGETGKIYVDLTTNKTYRWSGSTYVYITSGAVDSVAGKTGVVTLVKADVGLNSVDNTADADKNVLSATKWTTARTISSSGDVTWSVSANGSTNVTGVATLANSGVIADTYKSVSVDSKGRVTNGTNPTTLSGFGITDAYTKTEVQTALPKVGFDLGAAQVVTEGQLAWNATERTLDLGLGSDVVLQVGQEQLMGVQNNTGSTITNLTVCMYAGSIGNSGNFRVQPFSGTDVKKLVGVATENILDGGVGFVTTYGKIRGVDTRAWSVGQILYLGTNGALTNVVPTSGLKVPLAVVISSNINGTVFVRVNTLDENLEGQIANLGLTKADVTYVDSKVSSLSTDYYQGAYGISWDSTTDTYIRTGANGYTSIQSQMRRCVMNSDGTVNYYLHPTNSNFKADGTPSVLTGANGNVMVEIPKHYIKVETVGNVDSFSISLTQEDGYILDPAFMKWNGTAMVEVPYRYYRAYEGYVSGDKLLSVSGVTPTRSQTIATFRSQAMANGVGWHLTDWNLLNTIKRLCYIEFCDFIVTKYLGEGNYIGNDYGITTGQSNALGNRSSNSTHNDKYMSYRGIENLYADIWEFVDGVNINNYQFYVNGKYSTFASDVFTGDYVAKGPLTVAGANNSLIKRCAVSVDGGFIPTVVEGSTTTFYGDALWSNPGARVVLHGGDASTGASDGLGALLVNYASSFSHVALGAAVCR